MPNCSQANEPLGMPQPSHLCLQINAARVECCPNHVHVDVGACAVLWSTSWPPLSAAVLALRQLLPSVFSCRCRNAWICKRPLRVATPTQLTHLMRQKDAVWLLASAGPSQKAINGPKLSLSRCKSSPNTWECLRGCRRERKVHN